MHCYLQLGCSLQLIGLRGKFILGFKMKNYSLGTGPVHELCEWAGMYWNIIDQLNYLLISQLNYSLISQLIY